MTHYLPWISYLRLLPTILSMHSSSLQSFSIKNYRFFCGWIDRICTEFEAVTCRASQVPDSNADLVELIRFVEKSQTVHLPQLIDSVSAAGTRLTMLLDYTIFQRKFSTTSSIFQSFGIVWFLAILSDFFGMEVLLKYQLMTTIISISDDKCYILGWKLSHVVFLSVS